MRHYPAATWHNGAIMNIIAVVISMILFLSSFVLFAYAFAVPEEWAALTFFVGILSVTLSMAIPFQILGHRERD
jgi:K+-sensing histidine kinase KdpD